MILRFFTFDPTRDISFSKIVPKAFSMPVWLHLKERGKKFNEKMLQCYKMLCIKYSRKNL